MSDLRSRRRPRSTFAAVLVALLVALVPSVLAAATPSSAAAPPGRCVRVPLTGYLPPGRTASTALEPSSSWQWSASSAHQAFQWKLINRAGQVVRQGLSNGAGGSTFAPFNYYRWQVTNQGWVGQFWTVCFS